MGRSFFKPSLKMRLLTLINLYRIIQATALTFANHGNKVFNILPKSKHRMIVKRNARIFDGKLNYDDVARIMGFGKRSFEKTLLYDPNQADLLFSYDPSETTGIADYWK